MKFSKILILSWFPLRKKQLYFAHKKRQETATGYLMNRITTFPHFRKMVSTKSSLKGTVLWITMNRTKHLLLNNFGMKYLSNSMKRILPRGSILLCKKSACLIVSYVISTNATNYYFKTMFISTVVFLPWGTNFHLAGCS